MSEEINQEVEVERGILPLNIEEEMSSSYIDYSMSVIIGRALPDARDGLKPVHRRVLYAMSELGNTHNKPYKKSARVVGDVIGKYHPHSDQAVYDTIVRLAQDFSMRYPLVDGQGNFGSIDGDPPAAMRYTEVRMDAMAEEILDDIDKETVDFKKNYNEEFDEPVVLPSRFPNLLLNGSTGIAVGMATNMPPHNLRELADGIVHYIDNPECSIDDLMVFIKGPDFPTAATICGTRQIEAMYKLGRGQMTIRGVAEIVEERGRDVLIISELPYIVNKANLIGSIANLVNNKVIEGISDIRDESSGEGIRIVIELKRGAMGQIVLNNLYKHTQLQTTFGAIMLAITDGQPKVMNLKELIRCYVDHRFEVITRRTQFELTKAEARKHILEGLLIALDNLDEVVRTIRESKNRDEARTRLIELFSLSLRQADAILEMRLYQLTGLERDKVEAEYRLICERIDYLKGLLADANKIYALIKEDLIMLRQKYGDERRTRLVPMEGEVNIEDLIADEPCVVTLSHRGYIKRVPLTTYREQRRGGRGITGATTRDEDFIDTLFIAETHDTLLFFTSHGRVYAERAFEIPEASRTSPGKAIVNLLELREGETVAAMLRIREFREDQNVIFATEKGTVKKTVLADYRNVRRMGIIAINLSEDDRLIQVRLTNGNDDIILTTRSGATIRFNEADVRTMGRGATGVRGIRLLGDNVVCACDVVEEGATLLIACENGYGKRTPFEDFRKTRRGGQGIIGIQTTERNGPVVAAYAVREEESLVMVTANGMMVRSPVDQVRLCGRNTQGVRLINLEEGDKLVSASVAPAEDEECDKAETIPAVTETDGAESAEADSASEADVAIEKIEPNAADADTDADATEVE
ncbi:MAG: DNA gyrase subunit A [Lentisphaerae bacterium]|nr:DNA gyrase subunit A [Lentisphaerota bacterium]